MNVCLSGLVARLRLQTDPFGFSDETSSVSAVAVAAAWPLRSKLLSALLSMTRRYEDGQQLTKRLALIIDWTINGAHSVSLLLLTIDGLRGRKVDGNHQYLNAHGHQIKGGELRNLSNAMK